MLLFTAIAALVIPAALAAFIVMPTFWVRRYFLIRQHGVGPLVDASRRRFKLGGAAFCVVCYGLYIGGLFTDGFPWVTRFLERGGLMVVLPLWAITFAISRRFTVERAVELRRVKMNVGGV